MPKIPYQVFFNHDNNQARRRNLLKFSYIVKLVTIYSGVTKFHQILFIGLIISMVEKTLVWYLCYNPTQH